MDWLVQLEQGALGIGAFIVLFSFALYIKRTGDAKAIPYFLAKMPSADPPRVHHQSGRCWTHDPRCCCQTVYHTFFI